jgi:peptidylprolyl isomerase
MIKPFRPGWLPWLKIGLVSILLCLLSFPVINPALADSRDRVSTLAQGDAITDPEAILRYALPFENDTIRKLQGSLEDIAKGVQKKMWSKALKDVKNAGFLLNFRHDELLSSAPEERKAEAEKILDRITTETDTLRELVESQEPEPVLAQRDQVLALLTDFEELMVKEFPFEVPSEYSNLPQLKGRATIAMKTSHGDLTIVVDGYNAPVTAGNFVDLVQRGFYDDMDFIRSEDYFVLQAGDPKGPEQGFIDPKTKEYRAIPMEIMVKGESMPIYEYTLEEVGIYLDPPALPFNAYGAVALARPQNNNNGGSSQFFFFKWDRELTPPGFNLMDGQYAVFGYVTEGAKNLDKLQEGDKIISAKVIQGMENLVQPK